MNYFTRFSLFFVIITLYYDIIIVSSSDFPYLLPSCQEFQPNIIHRDVETDLFRDSREIDMLAVGRATRLIPVEGGRCSLFNFHENCGSIYIDGNFLAYESNTVEIIGFEKDGRLGEVYGFTVQRRPDTDLSIYDFTPLYKRISWMDQNGGVHRNPELLRETPRPIQNRLNFTIALVSANKNDITTVLGFRFCRRYEESDDLFLNGGFIAYDDYFLFNLLPPQPSDFTHDTNGNNITNEDIDHMLDIVVQLAKDRYGQCLLASLPNVPRDNVFVRFEN